MIDTKNRGGSLLRKHFIVKTNDPQTPDTELLVFGTVKGFIDISPAFIRLMGPGDANIEAKVRISPQKEHPFLIKEVKAKEGENIRFELKPLGNNPAKEGYELTVSNTKQDAGAYRDFILIETDLKEKPSLRIPVNGRIFGNMGSMQEKPTQSN